LLSEEEFLAAMMFHFKASTNDNDQLKRQAKRTFVALDSNKNCMLDYKEYCAGYRMLKAFLEDTWSRRAETAVTVATALPGGDVVSTVQQAAYQLGSTHSDIMEDFEALSESKTLLDKEYKSANVITPCCILLSMSMYTCLIFLLFLWPTVCLFLGWATGQTCDRPLAEFCQFMAILNTGMLVLNVIGISDQVRSKQKVKVPSNPLLVLVNNLVHLSAFILFCFGVYWYTLSGGFLGKQFILHNTGDCEKMAPDLFRFVGWYVWYVLITIGIAAVSLCCMCCAMCVQGGNRA